MKLYVEASSMGYRKHGLNFDTLKYCWDKKVAKVSFLCGDCIKSSAKAEIV